jgi:hypothetical protein
MLLQKQQQERLAISLSSTASAPAVQFLELCCWLLIALHLLLSALPACLSCLHRL